MGLENGLSIGGSGFYVWLIMLLVFDVARGVSRPFAFDLAPFSENGFAPAKLDVSWCDVV